MNMDSWNNDQRSITESYIGAINRNNFKLFEIIKDHSDRMKPIYPLVEFILERLECVMFLTTNWRLWDAEIVLRSAMETYVKLAFITSAATQEEKELRLNEYWNLLSEVLELKESEQAKKNLRTVPESEVHQIAFSPIILTEEKERLLREKWPKKERQRLEQKWSFSEILNSLSKNYNGSPMPTFDLLSYSYRTASHVSHGDETGVLIIRERNGRSEEEQNKANIGHYLRFLSDVLNYCTQTSFECVTFLKLPKEEYKSFIDNLRGIKEIEHLEKKYKGRVFDDVAYDKYRNKSEK